MKFRKNLKGGRNFMKIIIVLVFLALMTTSFTLATQDIEAGECEEFSFIEAIFNNETNLTEIFNKTKTFCAEDIEVNHCSIKNKVLQSGETYERDDEACDLEISCEANISTYDKDIEWKIYKDVNGKVRFTLGDYVETFDLDGPERTFGGIESMQCPEVMPTKNSELSVNAATCWFQYSQLVEANDECPNELTNTNKDYNEKNSDWEIRGNEIEDLTEDVSECKTEKINLEKRTTLAESNKGFWMWLAIISIVGWLCLGVYKIKEKVDGGPSLK